MPKPSGAQARATRLARLQTQFDSQGAVPLKQAAQALAVSEMTLRRDLAAPESTLAVLGGYVVGTQAPSAARYTLADEADQHAPNKRRAGQRAAALVQPGDSLFIDCGTTTPWLAEALPPDIPLDVVCYSLNIANILSRRPNTQLMLLGGLYHGSSASFASDEALAYLKRLGLTKAFVSAGGVHPERGASCSSFHEVPIKRAAIECAAESVLIVDESKLDRLKPAFFAPLSQFSRIIVGGAPAAPAKGRFKGIKLDVAA